jgi:anti-anti-sigma regulatory factor
MAFFSKPPAKKARASIPDVRPPSPSSAGTGHGASARELAAQVAPKIGRRQVEPAGGDVTGSGASLVQWTPAQSAFEVAQANPGLCAVLENAALRYASGQAAAARALLEEGITADADTKLSPLAWLALFDLLQRAGDKAAFDQLSMEYVVQFERSAPGWEARPSSQVAPRTVGGYLAVTGRLTAASAKQLEGLKRAIARKAEATRVDLMSVQSFDDVGARLLADALAGARRARIGLQVQQGVKLGQALDEAISKGREAGEGAWLLSLELLQWANNRAAFEDRAVDFAVTFELSPPSWEPPAPAATEEATAAAPHPAGHDDGSADADVLKWTGVLAGSLAPQLGKLAESVHGRAVVAVDVSEVERIDFVCAGALLNLITRLEAQRKAVHIVGASPIIRALLLLLGVSPRHFVKKTE